MLKPTLVLFSVCLFLGITHSGSSTCDYDPNKSVVFTTSSTWVVPAGITSICIALWGAGGAGGYGSTLWYDNSKIGWCQGGGGGSGAYGVKEEFSVSAGQLCTITVGSGGSSVTYPTSRGGKGGTTSITCGGSTLSVLGGYGGYGTDSIEGECDESEGGDGGDKPPSYNFDTAKAGSDATDSYGAYGIYPTFLGAPSSLSLGAGGGGYGERAAGGSGAGKSGAIYISWSVDDSTVGIVTGGPNINTPDIGLFTGTTLVLTIVLPLLGVSALVGVMIIIFRRFAYRRRLLVAYTPVLTTDPYDDCCTHEPHVSTVGIVSVTTAVVIH